MKKEDDRNHEEATTKLGDSDYKPSDKDNDDDDDDVEGEETGTRAGVNGGALISGKTSGTTGNQKVADGDRTKNNFMDTAAKKIIESGGSGKDSVYRDLHEVQLAIDEYKLKTFNVLRIDRSDSKRKHYRRYCCKKHIRCPFFIQFGSRRADGCAIIKKSCFQHYGEERLVAAKGGRKWKKRQHGRYDDEYAAIMQRKAAPPLPKDLIKTVQNEKGEDLTYHEAWRQCQLHSQLDLMKVAKSFEMIPSYAAKFMQINIGSSVEVVVNPTSNRVESFFLIPGYTNDIFKCVLPGISLDAAALKSPGKGVMEIYSVTTGNLENYVLAFGITNGYECEASWNFTNEVFSRNMPCLFKSRTDTMETLLPERTTAPTHNSFLLSDRDKGIAASLRKYFANHHSASCSRHIQSNIKQWFGLSASKPVVQLSKCFSTKQEDYLFGLIGKANKKAVTFLKDIEPTIWRGTAQTKIASIPARYGMTTSNAAECTK